MRKLTATASLIAAALSSALAATTYYVDGAVTASGNGSQTSPYKTIADGVGAASDGDVVRVAAGTYSITSQIGVSKGITIQPDPDKPGTVTIDANTKCRVFDINHADAVVEGVRIYRGQNSALAENGGGVRFGANGGTLRNCIIESCVLKQNTSSYGGGGVYVPAGATVTGCIIKDCYSTVNGDTRGVGAWVKGGTLERTLVVGCKRTSYAEYRNTSGAVYIDSGIVDRCTIVANVASSGALYVTDSASAVVRDTIVWGNVSFREAGAGRPNVTIGARAIISGLCTTAAFGTGAVVANPSFIDAANGDYRLSPASPCIGAGTGGADLGYADYDATAAPIGIAASASRGVDSLQVAVSLVPAAGVSLSGATVSWEGLAETGTSFTHTFGPGTYTLRATITLPGEPPVTVALPDAIQVTCTGDIYVDDDSATPVSPYSSPATAAKTVDAALEIAGDGAVIHVAEGNYELNPTNYFLIDNVKVIGSGRREATILTKKSKKGRFFYLGNAGAAVCNLTMRNGGVEGYGGGIWIAGDGGVVSNCTVQGCTTSASQNGGGVLMDSAAAILTHSLIMGNTAGAGGAGSGIHLSKGTVDNCLVISNKVSYNTRSAALGGGIYLGPMSGAGTANAKVVNCTVAANDAYNGGGIYRVKDTGFVYNTIVYGNTSYNGSANIAAPDGTTRPVATSFANCCTSESIGTDCQIASAPPYELPSYELSGTASPLCIDLGDNAYVLSDLDYAGSNRVFNGVVDIGAFEYGKSSASVAFVVDAVSAAGDHTFTFTATAVGLDLSGCTCQWFFDGASTADGTGAVYTKTLGVGRHAVRLVVTAPGGVSYLYEEAEGFITVYPPDAYVNAAGTAPAWPYATPETAATNLNVAVDEVLRPGVTLHVAEGNYPVTKTVSVGGGQRIVGAGMDRTCVWAVRSGNVALRVLTINGTGAYVEGLCISNGLAVGGGVHISGDGGTFNKGRIVKCRGTTNQAGGGAFMTGSYGKIANSEIIENETFIYNSGSGYNAGVDHSGGGVDVEGYCILENCLVRNNRACSGGGVVVAENGVVRNCTVVSNWTETTTGNREGGGGIIVRGNGNVVNSIFWGNFDLANGDPASLAHNVSGSAGRLVNCCAPVAAGANCVTNNPRFKNAATGDYRIRGSSPCRGKGLYQAWMADATDFFGNPRARGSHVDIGYFQSPPASTAIFLQ